MKAKGNSQSVSTSYNEPRFKDVRIIMEAAALQVGGEAGVNMWKFPCKHSSLRAFVEIIFSK